MTSLTCKNCDHEKNSIDGICIIKNASDGIPCRCVGGWSNEKLYYLKKYVDTFTTSMRNKWNGEIYYIDFFAGPGKCIVRDNEEEIDGSPLISLNTKYPFKEYYFVDKSLDASAALGERCRNHQYIERIRIINNDCNEAVHDIIDSIPKRSLSLAFIDPNGLEPKFQTIEKLAQRKVDLIIIFHDSIAIGRNMKKFLEEDFCALDNFIGDTGWRKFKSSKELIRHPTLIIDYYKEKLKSLSYKDIKSGTDIPIRSTTKNLPLYSLLFASKHELGQRFWDEICDINHTGQRKLRFD